ncbi:hypothetical protein A3D84_03175 [Candidatus Woesebacteria bacterium RIFCSPHIGHO2_02_FULL_42_20]|uniref:Uncharacterized protein n=1 Tax=Candidatus Woesebacteria bacterium RIFCSPHIGHO2_12_FULL_41_24 TaxID=1802510 RepID=A0A1F8ARS9_9BACT|nr:MAG: hypothetical protein A2W15_03365 [Candidatus Woesebacteria bacterium RBG_16_41_13]OGM29394.1 MAG: hypothetical protein A2873_04620 [Candidatus Woesebacteria bacterium RIFCSPHIGHO2_01_FULL_42_80]OGM34843.1 MAG: hypothetical protein A3D84_03175 [Candidatus Woesebacteria bacterium RIFCSPHIGHO2_02_FULL_42_20]OGM54472.1 MAG: hypothetical protein A3E44_00210 [Candidatus Woesebacteria bacterium RIFCSPHIGHO2_12_FULL_41_24]OGM65716.1 MAG: hypothetical protein A2969_00610 [Candidatus Woesebacteri
MKKEKICLQQTHGPTPCFQNDTKSTVCSLNFCPASEHLQQHPQMTTWQVLDTHCVMSDAYGRQHDYEAGKGEFVATIALLAESAAGKPL